MVPNGWFPLWLCQQQSHNQPDVDFEEDDDCCPVCLFITVVVVLLVFLGLFIGSIWYIFR
jgi:hypothetical protein